MSDKNERIARLKLILMNAPDEGWKIEDLVRMSGIEYKNIHRDLNDIGAKTVSYARYVYEPTDSEVEFAKAVLKTIKRTKE